MKNTIKRLLCLLLVLMLFGSMVPAPFASAAPETGVAFTEEDYASADAVFSQIDLMENAPAKKNASQKEKTDAAAAIVLASDSYVDGSLERSGNAFTWRTEEGIRCAYNPAMQQKRENMTAPEHPLADGIYNEPVPTRGGWPTGRDVYVIGPYYGLDSDFTDQYQNEAARIAQAIGDTDGYTLYSGSAATIDKVAEAMSKGAVVIFDSHGTTDYENPYDEYDYVTEANYSYLCLTSNAGLTQADYDGGALYSYGDAYVTGNTIANHMTSNSPAGILWMAICLGMATDTICQPMREKGVEVVYGYSQSVSFAGDYCWEETFWEQMCQGATVSTAISTMKTRYGRWDCSQEICDANGWEDDYVYPTIADARAEFIAFPVVVSDEDAHPGQRSASGFYGADCLQSVQSTYTLYPQYDIAVSANNPTHGTVSINAATITAQPASGYFTQGYTVLSGSAAVTQNGNTFLVHATSDCAVQINFAPKTPVTVQFPGTEATAQNGYAGDEMHLPRLTAPAGYEFVGWTTAQLNHNTSQKPDFYTDSFIPTLSMSLYALYSYIQPGTSTGTGNYVQVTEAPTDWSGEYQIVYKPDSLVFDGSLSKLDQTSNYQTVPLAGNAIDGQTAKDYHFTIEKVSGGYTIQSAGGLYIGKEENSNGLDAGADPYVNKISLSASGEATIVGAGGAHLRFNSTSGQDRFRYYKASTYTNQQPVYLYRKDGNAGTVYYTSSLTSPPPHVHSFTNYVSDGNATCTADGTETAQCDGCSDTDTRAEVGSALGHKYGALVVSPTCLEKGFTYHGCERCEDSYLDEWTNPVGHHYTSANTSAGVVYTCTACGYNYTAPYGSGWQSIGGKWYLYKDGTMLTGWQKDGGVWYYMNGAGVMQTGWQYIDGAWYYLKSSGAMATGWLKDGGTWYYLKSSGAMATGWLQIGGVWYFFKSGGAMATGWLQTGGIWYFFKSSGAMATGWVSDGGTWYYFKSSGAMATGWVKDGSYWYYFNSSGAMIANTSRNIGGKVYRFNASGVCLNP